MQKSNNRGLAEEWKHGKWMGEKDRETEGRKGYREMNGHQETKKEGHKEGTSQKWREA